MLLLYHHGRARTCPRHPYDKGGLLSHSTRSLRKETVTSGHVEKQKERGRHRDRRQNKKQSRHLTTLTRNPGQDSLSTWLERVKQTGRSSLVPGR